MESTSIQNNTISRARFRGEMMNQIYRIWLFRRLLPVLIFEVLMIAAILYELGRAVFVERVFQNGLNVLFTHPSGILLFITSAFSHATILTKLLIVGFIFVIALALRHVTQGMLRLILVRANYFSKMK